MGGDHKQHQPHDHGLDQRHGYYVQVRGKNTTGEGPEAEVTGTPSAANSPPVFSTPIEKELEENTQLPHEVMTIAASDPDSQDGAVSFSIDTTVDDFFRDRGNHWCADVEEAECLPHAGLREPDGL